MNQQSQKYTFWTPLLAAAAKPYHESMRKLLRRMHTWPAREVNAFKEEDV